MEYAIFAFLKFVLKVERLHLIYCTKYISKQRNERNYKRSLLKVV